MRRGGPYRGEHRSTTRGCPHGRPSRASEGTEVCGTGRRCARGDHICHRSPRCSGKPRRLDEPAGEHLVAARGTELRHAEPAVSGPARDPQRARPQLPGPRGRSLPEAALPFRIRRDTERDSRERGAREVGSHPSHLTPGRPAGSEAHRPGGGTRLDHSWEWPFHGTPGLPERSMRRCLPASRPADRRRHFCGGGAPAHLPRLHVPLELPTTAVRARGPDLDTISGAFDQRDPPAPESCGVVGARLTGLRSLKCARPTNASAKPRHRQLACHGPLGSLEAGAAFACRPGEHEHGRQTDAVWALRRYRRRTARLGRPRRRGLPPGARRRIGAQTRPRRELPGRRDIRVGGQHQPVGTQRAGEPRVLRRRRAPELCDRTSSFCHLVEAARPRRHPL